MQTEAVQATTSAALPPQRRMCMERALQAPGPRPPRAAEGSDRDAIAARDIRNWQVTAPVLCQRVPAPDAPVAECAGVAAHREPYLTEAWRCARRARAPASRAPPVRAHGGMAYPPLM